MLDALARHAQAIRDLPLVSGGVEELRPLCAAHGWPEEPPGSGSFLVEEPVELLADWSDDDEEAPARVVLHRWEEWDVEDHPNRAEYRAALRAFDDLYDRTRDLLGRLWGPPIASGRYRVERQRFRWAMWPGAGGLRILAQDEPDIQCGIELDLWLVPWRDGDDLPEMPLF